MSDVSPNVMLNNDKSWYCIVKRIFRDLPYKCMSLLKYKAQPFSICIWMGWGKQSMKHSHPVVRLRLMCACPVYAISRWRKLGLGDKSFPSSQGTAGHVKQSRVSEHSWFVFYLLILVHDINIQMHFIDSHITWCFFTLPAFKKNQYLMQLCISETSK